eukprot:COSAG01_NODE_540_length_15746_cov_291.364299_15_plen_70_part_00
MWVKVLPFLLSANATSATAHPELSQGEGFLVARIWTVPVAQVVPVHVRPAGCVCVNHPHASFGPLKIAI